MVSKGKYQQILKGTVARGSTSVVGFTCFFWDVPKSWCWTLRGERCWTWEPQPSFSLSKQSKPWAVLSCDEIDGSKNLLTVETLRRIRFWERIFLQKTIFKKVKGFLLPPKNHGLGLPPHFTGWIEWYQGSRWLHWIESGNCLFKCWNSPSRHPWHLHLDMSFIRFHPQVSSFGLPVVWLDSYVNHVWKVTGCNFQPKDVHLNIQWP